MSWGFKKLLRVKKKLVEKYAGNPNRVTDIARTSLVFKKLVALKAALDYLLDTHGAIIPVLKNRLRKPADGYVDVLVNVWVGDHLCEIQLHLESVYAVKGEGGHGTYKWMRRLLQPDNVYEGERDSEGDPHGKGVMTFASGEVYDGEWKAGNMDGKGVMKFASGGARPTPPPPRPTWSIGSRD